MILISIGKSRDNRIVLKDHQSISREHAEIKVKDDGSIFLLDKSTNGTAVNGKRVSQGVEVPLNRGDQVIFAGVAQLDWSQIPHLDPPPPDWKLYSIGKDLNNRIRINDPSQVVSSFHATIKIAPNGKMFINDHSKNGTFVNGARIPSNVDTPVKRRDKIMLAYQPFDWATIPSSGPNMKHIVMPVAAAVVIGLLIFVGLRSDWSFGNKWEKYQSATSLIYHAYYYVVTLEDQGFIGTLSFGVTEKGEPDLVAINGNMVEKNPTPYGIAGTGFFITNDGKLVTNKHIAEPWSYLDEKTDFMIRNEVGKILNLSQNYYVELFKQIATKDNIDDVNAALRRLRNNNIRSIGGYTSTIRIGFYDYYYESLEKFEPCQILITSDRNDIDLAIIQTNDKRLPTSVKTIVDISNAASINSKLKVGDELVYIGYPAGLTMNYRPQADGLKPIVKFGNLQRDPSSITFDINAEALGGASGSPAFLKKNGQLIGVINSGFYVGSSFTMGILSKHIQKLLDETR